MSWCRKTSIRGLLAVVAVMAMWGISGFSGSSGVAYGSEGTGGHGGPGGPAGSDLWAAATIEPGREGIVEVGGYEGAPLGEGSVLTLTAPAKARVTGTPFAALGYRGTVALGGSNGTYTFEGASASAAAEREAVWKGRTFPFVLSVPPDAEPGTRLPDCALVLKDANGTVRQRGTCTVTVGLPEPTLDGPQSGVPLSASPQMSGTAYPGAQVTVRDALEEEVCSTTTAPDGTWSCTPVHTLPPGPGRLQATATLNGVSATSEQIHITVAGR
ncbi:carboxypeptidase regulatory-like domain-containing protein [Streptomyces sp. HD]|uniref:carboxypeptidase regulatory-like domain-containing protein n=1 Tax=Streptomyces sp. HD TaxID=3020892 RepID=UPI00232AAECD|nr:carboxypeptidase regulatory-like domain-containing protein [Streptomyces sp. HD]MDC0770498.1 carboxypeptidase regulatory-like domain-containing protein [Streptomyces sp. HD]